MRTIDQLLPSLVFGGIAVATTAIYFAIVGLAPALFGVALSVSDSHRVPFWVSGPMLVIGPVMLGAAAGILAIPAGLVASGLFFVASLVGRHWHLPRATYPLFGALAGYLGALLVLTWWWGKSVTSFALWLGAVSGLIASLLLIYLPAFRQISAPLLAAPNDGPSTRAPEA